MTYQLLKELKRCEAPYVCLRSLNQNGNYFINFKFTFVQNKFDKHFIIFPIVGTYYLLITAASENARYNSCKNLCVHLLFNFMIILYSGTVWYITIILVVKY